MNPDLQNNGSSARADDMFSDPSQPKIISPSSEALSSSTSSPDTAPLESSSSENLSSEDSSRIQNIPVSYAEMSRDALIEELIALRQQNAHLQREREEFLATQSGLLDSVQHYCDILEHSVAGFFQSTPDGRYILVNRAIAHMLGYESSAEMMALIHDISTQVYYAAQQRQTFITTLNTTGKITGFEYQAFRKDGSTVWLSEDARVVRDETGQILYYEGSCVNITKRKQAEEALHQANQELEQKVEERTAALRESNDYLIAEIAERKQAEDALRANQQLLRAIIDSVPAMINAKDTESCYIIMNDYQARLYGVSPAQAIGRTAGDMLGYEYGNYTSSLDQQVIASGEALPFFEEYYADSHGEFHSWLTTKAPLKGPTGEVRGVVTTAVDITHRKKAEKALSATQDQLEAILETIPGIVSWISSDLRYLGANRHLASMFGLEPEAFVNQDIGFLNASSEFNEFVRKFFRSSDQEAFQEFTAQVNGEERIYLIVVQKYNEGQAAFAVGIDVTDRRRAEMELQAAKDQLQAALDAVPGIVSWISADLKYLGVNRHLATLFNLPPTAFIGQDIGFLHTSQEFTEFVQDLFKNPDKEASREITAYVNATIRRFLIMAQKYDQDQAAFTVGIDITDQREAQVALTAAEAKYRSIFESVVEGIFQTTPDGQYLSANPALARIYGYQSPEELMVKLTSIQNQLYVDPTRRQTFVQRLQEQDEVYGFESQVYRKDGSLIWISENARAVRDDDGTILYFEGSVEDITERKHAVQELQRAKADLENKVSERTQTLQELNDRLVTEIAERRRIEGALRTSEAELRALFAAMTDYIAVFDAQGRYRKIVSTSSDLLYSPDLDRIGKTVYDVLPPDKAALFVIHIQRALNTGQTISLEYSLTVTNTTSRSGRDPDDIPAVEEAWYSASVSPMPDSCVIWVARDITERKRAESALREAEAKYRSIFENAVEGIFQTTLSGDVLSVNPSLALMYGYSSPQELRTELQSIDQIYVDPNRRSEFIHLLEKENFISDFESQVRRRDGKIIWTSESARAVRNDEGQLQYYEGTVQDITIRKQAEIALKAEQQKSERLLLNILPLAIAEQLKQNPQATAKRFEEATILFADIVDFTSFSTQISPTGLVDLLNRIFSNFDRLAEIHNLEKIKTIGDAYMVVGGLPTPREDHVEAIANMALDMQKTITTFQRNDGRPFQLRIGIHTGPVVAGVIGIKKFIYDLWGDTVNVASRMESKGVPDHIQVTHAVYEQLQEWYDLEARGTVDIKGRGPMQTYWLRGKKEG